MSESVIFRGTVEKTLQRDEGNGRTVFLVRTPADIHRNDGSAAVLCIGETPPLLPKVPVLIEAEESVDEAGKVKYKTKKIEEQTETQREMVSFLIGGAFGQITENTAVKISSIVNGNDLFAWTYQTEDLHKALLETGAGERTVGRITERLVRAASFRRLYNLLAPLGVPFAVIRDFHIKYGKKAVDVVQKSPYTLVKAGASFPVCETLAEQFSGQKNTIYSRERLRALLGAAWKRIEARGWTVCTFWQLRDTVYRIETKAKSEHMHPFYLLAGLYQEGYHVEKENEKVYVTTEGMWETERRITEHIQRLEGSGIAHSVTEEEISQIEAENGIAYSKEQRSAFRLLERGGIAILTGGPGTGKTTVIRGLIEAFKRAVPDAVITACAPTGTAAKRLSASIGMKASTIHKLLDIRPFAGLSLVQNKDEYNNLDADMLIVDEASMIDEELFLMLVRAVKNGALILLSGDEDQLPSVGCGNVLHDLLDDEAIRRCRLRQVFRQKDGSSIIENSRKIRNGKSDLAEDAHFCIKRYPNTERLKEYVKNIAKNDAFSNPEKMRIFTSARTARYPVSAEALNQVVQKQRVDPNEEVFLYNGESYSKGEPVLFLRNNYKLGYFNGDIGRVASVIRDGGASYLAVSLDKRLIYLSGSLMGDLTHAYAMTVHKAQGGECETSIIALPQEPSVLLQRGLIYVAVTRARKNVLLLSEGDALEKAIASTRAQIRQTGLAGMLKGA